MSGQATHNVIVLWENELRIAAQALQRLYEADSAATEPDPDLMMQLAHEAVQACRAALYHLGLPGAEHAAVVVTVAPKPKQQIAEDYPDA